MATVCVQPCSLSLASRRAAHPRLRPPGLRLQAVQRIAFGTFLFFALHLVLLLGVTSTRSPRLALHTGFWPFKLLLWGGGYFGATVAAVLMRLVLACWLSSFTHVQFYDGKGHLSQAAGAK